MIPAQSATVDATTNARLRRADQRGSAGAGSERGAEIGKVDTVTDGSFGVRGSSDRNAVLRPVWGSALFKVRQAANAKHFKMGMTLLLPRGIRRPSPISCPKGGACSVLFRSTKAFEFDHLKTPQRLTDECPDF